MIQISDGSSRRILTFPAVHPCEDIAPTTLIGSLITFACKICSYKSEIFSSNRRNGREVIRVIGILADFLEEIQDRQVGLSDLVVLCLSELHLTSQKIEYLLEDCTRQGGRIWMLMKSAYVADQFRVLVRAIAAVLDVLPLESINVSIEIKEMIELVIRQAWKAKFEVEVEDRRALKVVVSMLNGFENRIVPDRSDLRWVLDHIGIRSWKECNQEVKFLDAEIGLESLNEEKTKVALLSSLMGFMSYCRCVMFDVVDGQVEKQSIGRCSSEVLSCLNPDDFRCPISLEFMTDPVTIATGHTYDRSSIVKWFKAGNPICPKTGEKLTNMEFIPNLALQRLIRQYCSDNGIPVAEHGSKKHDITRTALAGSLAAKEAMRMLGNSLAARLEGGTSEERNKAAYEIRVLAKTNIFNRSCLAEAGTIPHLLNLLSSTDSVAQESAIAALLNLSKLSKSKKIIIESGGLTLILDILKRGLMMEARQHAAATLFYLSSVEEYRILIGKTPEAIPALMELIKDGTNRGKKNALVAIFGLLMHPDNHWRVLGAGAVPLLVNLLSSTVREDLLTDSLAVLATLAEKPDGTIAILRRKTLNSVVEILNSSPSRAGKEYCVSLLLALCINGGRDVVALLVKNTSLIGSLYSLLTEGTPRASKKVSALIRMLHEFHERSSSGMVTSAIPQEQYVHVW